MKKVCSVYDNKAKLFSLPFFSHSLATATRDFQAAALDVNSQISKYPGDFELWTIGEWHEETGVMVPLDHIEFVTRADALTFKE